MNTILRPVLELTVMISGLFLAYLPVQTYLKQPPGRLAAWLAPLLAGICLLEGGFCYFLNIPTSSVLFPTLLVLMLIYHKSLTISIWKSGSIFLAVCAVFACKQPFQSSKCHCGRKTWTSRNRNLVSHQCRYFLQCNMSSVRCCRLVPGLPCSPHYDR